MGKIKQELNLNKNINKNNQFEPDEYIQIYGLIQNNIWNEGNGIWERFNIIVGINVGLLGLIAVLISSSFCDKESIVVKISLVGFLVSIWSFYVLHQLWQWHEHWRNCLIKIEKSSPEIYKDIRLYSEIEGELKRESSWYKSWLLSYTQPFMIILIIVWVLVFFSFIK